MECQASKGFVGQPVSNRHCMELVNFQKGSFGVVVVASETVVAAVGTVAVAVEMVVVAFAVGLGAL